MTLGDLGGTMFNGFCTVIGCGGNVGFALVGIFVFAIMVITMYKLRIGFDGVIVIGPIVGIALVQGGLVPAWFAGIIYAVIAVVIGVGIYKVFNR